MEMNDRECFLLHSKLFYPGLLTLKMAKTCDYATSRPREYWGSRAMLLGHAWKGNRENVREKHLESA